jgi:hypothetical protein
MEVEVDVAVFVILRVEVDVGDGVEVGDIVGLGINVWVGDDKFGVEAGAKGGVGIDAGVELFLQASSSALQ